MHNFTMTPNKNMNKNENKSCYESILQISDIKLEDQSKNI